MNVSLVCTDTLAILWFPYAIGDISNPTAYTVTIISMNMMIKRSVHVYGNTTMMTIGDLIDGTNYTVIVTAINCAGSSNSSSVSVQTCELCKVVCVHVFRVLHELYVW